jgi:hypothetical protein
MVELGFWIFASVCVFCILLWNLSKLRYEYEERGREERVNLHKDEDA